MNLGLSASLGIFLNQERSKFEETFRLDERLQDQSLFLRGSTLLNRHVHVLDVLVDLRELTKTSDGQVERFVGANDLELQSVIVSSDLRREELYVQSFRLLWLQSPPRNCVTHWWQSFTFCDFASRGVNRELSDLGSLTSVWWLLEDGADEGWREWLLIRIGPDRLRDNSRAQVLTQVRVVILNVDLLQSALSEHFALVLLRISNVLLDKFAEVLLNFLSVGFPSALFVIRELPRANSIFFGFSSFSRNFLGVGDLALTFLFSEDSLLIELARFLVRLIE